ncbi:MAG: hydrogenase expression/formation protein HypE [Actinomycetota bacterium]|nr:hydrogenase expression/formation protein HypE [Actinomycetota bacterium]
MAHGAGGKATNTLVEGLFVPAFPSETLTDLADAAVLDIEGAALAMTTDAFVVKPLRFPGGSIGELAVNGTVNDLAAGGARPVALTAAFILEEGLDSGTLVAEVQAMADAARAAGVNVAAGDTKVVERGKADGMYIVTTGLGVRDAQVRLSPQRVRPGDQILCSGFVGDHGTAIMLARGELELDADIVSDTAPLTEAAQALLRTGGEGVHAMRDPTRGGVATVLNEIAAGAGVGVVLDEGSVPVRPTVTGACEILGIDPMYVANEGVLLAFVAPEVADDALASLLATPAGRDAAVIGEVDEEPAGMVLVRTAFGGTRIMDMLIGDPLPRIC